MQNFFNKLKSWSLKPSVFMFINGISTALIARVWYEVLIAKDCSTDAEKRDIVERLVKKHNGDYAKAFDELDDRLVECRSSINPSGREVGDELHKSMVDIMMLNCVKSMKNKHTYLNQTGDMDLRRKFDIKGHMEGYVNKGFGLH